MKHTQTQRKRFTKPWIHVLKCKQHADENTLTHTYKMICTQESQERRTRNNNSWNLLFHNCTKFETLHKQHQVVQITEMHFYSVRGMNLLLINSSSTMWTCPLDMQSQRQNKIFSQKNDFKCFRYLQGTKQQKPKGWKPQADTMSIVLEALSDCSHTVASLHFQTPLYFPAILSTLKVFWWAVFVPPSLGIAGSNLPDFNESSDPNQELVWIFSPISMLISLFFFISDPPPPQHQIFDGEIKPALVFRPSLRYGHGTRYGKMLLWNFLLINVHVRTDQYKFKSRNLW